MLAAVKVLFIGGTGNISTDCAEALHARGDEIWMLTRGTRPVPPWANAIAADRRDRGGMRMALAGKTFDAVANFLGFQVPDIQIDFECLGERVGQYIFISSATVYSKPHQRIPLTENSRLGNRFSDYARNKEMCEGWLMTRLEKSRFPVTIVRPSLTYSSGWIPNPVSSRGYAFAARLEKGEPVFLHDGGRTQCALTASSDFASGFAGLVGQEKAIGEAFHITSEETLTWADIYSEIVRAFGFMMPRIVSMPTDFICQVVPELTAKLKGDKSEPNVFDNSKIRRFVPGFKCSVLFREGIRRSAGWFRGDPARRSVDQAVNEQFDRVFRAWLRRIAP
jgi:nucleoside-diphosphate-sugar epimerase